MCITQGINSSINDVDYLQFKRFVSQQISLLKNNNKIDKNTPLGKLLRKSENEGNFGIQEDSEFYLGNIKCWRYNIEKKIVKVSEEENKRFMNFVWTFMNEEKATVTVSIPIKNRSTFVTKTTNLDEKGSEYYFVVHCNIPEDKDNLTNEIKFANETNSNFKAFTNTSGQFHKSHEILVNETNLMKSLEQKFSVKKFVDNLNIVVLGNISKIDLQIPVDQERLFQWNENGKISDIIRSLKRMTQTMGLRLNVRNPPPGDWSLKITPGENSNYHFIIATVFNDSKTEEENRFKTNDNATNEFKEERQEEIVAESRFNEKLVEKPRNYMEGDNASSIQISSRSFELDDNEENEKWIPGNLSQSTNLESRIAFPDFSKEEIVNNNRKVLVGPQIENRIQHESLELDDLTRSTSDGFFQKKLVTVDVSSDSNLIIRTGTGRVRINFDVKNNQIKESILCYRAVGSPIEVVQVYPSNPRLSVSPYCNLATPGQIVTVTAEIFIPLGISDTVNPITLTVLVDGSDSKAIRKTANLFIQNSNLRKFDDTRPIIKYYFNNNCGGYLREDRCSKSIWSVDITVQDVDSGLKLVTSSPSGIETQTDYISGTTNQVTFFYYATCCHRIVDISAVDMYGNYNNRRIDVTEWDNLNDGEIIAIVMGALFLILLIIFIILLIMYCLKKTKSRDLPYTQRYGSGSPEQRPERTRF